MSAPSRLFHTYTPPCARTGAPVRDACAQIITDPFAGTCFLDDEDASPPIAHSLFRALVHHAHTPRFLRLPPQEPPPRHLPCIHVHDIVFNVTFPGSTHHIDHHPERGWRIAPALAQGTYHPQRIVVRFPCGQRAPLSQLDTDLLIVADTGDSLADATFFCTHHTTVDVPSLAHLLDNAFDIATDPHEAFVEHSAARRATQTLRTAAHVLYDERQACAHLIEHLAREQLAPHLPPGSHLALSLTLPPRSHHASTRLTLNAHDMETGDTY